MVFAFGGGWMDGTTEQFSEQGEALAAMGYLAVVPEYRVYTRDHTTVETAMKDFFSFLRHLGANAGMYGVDTERVVLVGASAGGHLVLSAMLLAKMDWRLTIRGLVLFNPVVDTTEAGYQSAAILQQDFAPVLYSPIHHLRAGLPPMLILCGSNDTVVPVGRIHAFAEKAEQYGNTVELVLYEGREHGFFNRGNGRRAEDFEDTLLRCQQFCKNVFAL